MPASYADRTMSPADVEAWLAAMREAELAPTAYSAAALLNLQPRAMSKIRARGADMRTALACAALLSGLKPYTAAKPKRARKAKAEAAQ